jgi:type IV pilus assembly protein PilO
MKLSPREQLLLTILIVLALLAGGYYLVYLPLSETHNQLQTEREDLQLQYDETMARIASIDRTKAELNDLAARVNERTKVYFPSIIQEKLMLTLNPLYAASDVTVKNETFTLDVGHDLAQAPAETKTEDPNSLKALATAYNAALSGQAAPAAQTTEAQPADEAAQKQSEEEAAAQKAAVTSIESMNLNLTCSGTYIQMTDLMRYIENLNRKVQFESLSLTKSDSTQVVTTDAAGNQVAATISNNRLDCSFTLSFHAIPKLVTQDQEYEAWELMGSYGKADPFTEPVSPTQAPVP